MYSEWDLWRCRRLSGAFWGVVTGMLRFRFASKLCALKIIDKSICPRHPMPHRHCCPTNLPHKQCDEVTWNLRLALRLLLLLPLAFDVARDSRDAAVRPNMDTRVRSPYNDSIITELHSKKNYKTCLLLCASIAYYYSFSFLFFSILFSVNTSGSLGTLLLFYFLLLSLFARGSSHKWSMPPLSFYWQFRSRCRDALLPLPAPLPLPQSLLMPVEQQRAY